MRRHENNIVLSKVELTALLAHTSKDKFRDIITRVNLTAHNGRIEASATDGHRAMRLSSTAWEGPSIHYIVPRSELDTSVRLARGKDELFIGPTTITVGVSTTPWKDENGYPFPPMHQIIDMSKKTVLPENVYFKPSYLAEAYDTFAKLGATTVCTNSLGGGYEDPIFISALIDTTSVEIVIMPAPRHTA